jgi:hypothetical protein
LLCECLLLQLKGAPSQPATLPCARYYPANLQHSERHADRAGIKQRGLGYQGKQVVHLQVLAQRATMAELARDYSAKAAGRLSQFGSGHASYVV